MQIQLWGIFDQLTGREASRMNALGVSCCRASKVWHTYQSLGWQDAVVNRGCRQSACLVEAAVTCRSPHRPMRAALPHTVPRYLARFHCLLAVRITRKVMRPTGT
ncbi:MAG: hypothetical protein KDJ65_26370 [Anaerolineae bacterium]|nr:hypothetical protein [Anaerolineae bacterium]